MVVADAAARLSNVLHAGFSRPLNVVAKGEERVGADRHAGLRGDPSLLFLHTQHFGPDLKDILPDTVGQQILILVGGVDVDGVVAVGAADVIHKLQPQYLGMLTQIPVVGLLAGKAGAVDTALLARTHSDSLSILDVTDRVGLCIFERDECNDHVDLRLFRQRMLFCDDMGKQRFIDLKVVPALMESDAKDILVFLRRGNVVRIDLHNIVAALFLGLKGLKCFVGIARGNDAVGDFFLEIPRRGSVTHVAQRRPVAVGAQPVSAARTDIGTGNGAQLRVLGHKVNLSVHIAQRQAHGRTGGRNVLEGCRSGKPGRLLQFANKLPGIECVKEIDVAGLAVQHGDGKRTAVFHKDT